VRGEGALLNALVCSGTRGEAGRVRARLPCLGVFLFVRGGAWAAGTAGVQGWGGPHTSHFSPRSMYTTLRPLASTRARHWWA
jgi:hypothetical protein